jgi:hypothetical protein
MVLHLKIDNNSNCGLKELFRIILNNMNILFQTHKFFLKIKKWMNLL